MRVLLRMMWGTTTTVLIRNSWGRGSSGVCKCTGRKLPSRPSRALNLILSMHITWVTHEPTHRLFLLNSHLPLQVYTSAYDSTVRSLSFTSGISREVFAMENVLITSVDAPPASHELWLSDAKGWVTHLDLREDKSKRRSYQLSEMKIGNVSVNPTNPAFILTPSNNRTLK